MEMPDENGCCDIDPSKCAGMCGQEYSIVESLRRENEEQARILGMSAEIELALRAKLDLLERENEKLKAKLDKAKDALRFYGDNHPYPNDGPFGAGSTDFGHRARTTLDDLGE